MEKVKQVDAKEAVNQLRLEAALQAGFAALSYRGELSDMLDAAADTIDALQAEVERLKDTIRLCQEVFEARDETAQLRRRLDAAKQVDA